jgi:hypothetical protein
MQDIQSRLLADLMPIKRRPPRVFQLLGSAALFVTEKTVLRSEDPGQAKTIEKKMTAFSGLAVIEQAVPCEAVNL